jgi:hypothetical protein
MDEVQNPSNSKCYTPSSEPFRIYSHPVYTASNDRIMIIDKRSRCSLFNPILKSLSTEEYHPLECNAVCSVDVHRRFGGTCCLHLSALLVACFLLVSCLSYSSTLMMEAVHSWEKSLNIYELQDITSQKVSTLHYPRCEEPQIQHEFCVIPRAIY